MTKLMDFAFCDDDTEKRAAVRIHDLPTEVLPIVRSRCDGGMFYVECGAAVSRDGLCALHYYQMRCIENWDEIRRQMTRREQAS